METLKIVFTGGPCAGKTTLIKMLKKYFKENNINFLSISETATDLLSSEFNKNTLNNIYNFQEYILERQIFKESEVDKLLKLNKKNKFVVLYDRGLLDNKAYLSDYTEFDKLLSSHKLSEIDILYNYDIVFDLITTADCDPSKYTLSTNCERTESLREAIELDKKTSNAWVGHKSMKIINSSISIDEAFNIIKNIVDELLKGITTKEITKMKICNTLEDFQEYDDNNSRLFRVSENKINGIRKEFIYKIYKKKYKNSYIYELKVYKKDGNIERIYFDSKISESEYVEILNKYDIKSYNEYYELMFVENRQEYDVKFYEDKTTLEYEENKLNQEFVLPSVIKLKEEKKTLIKEKQNIGMV